MTVLSFALAALAACPTSRAITQDYYTTNAVCKQRYCIDPVFPGLDQLELLEDRSWKKYEHKLFGDYFKFCRNFIDYDFALPIINRAHTWNVTGNSTQDLISTQEALAAKLYFYHLSAMGLEAWDYQTPEKEVDLPHGPCAKQVARMACFTYLPMANPLVQAGMSTRYIRPCKSTCENYVKTCQVDCCDDSVQCVFDRKEQVVPDRVDLVFTAALQIKSGYLDYDGPSAMCTGGARRIVAVPTLLAFLFAMRA
jgi:hypothetical protein